MVIGEHVSSSQSLKKLASQNPNFYPLIQKKNAMRTEKRIRGHRL